MANFYDDNGNKRFLDLEGLAYYDEKIKGYVDAAQSEADGAAAQALVDAKAYTDEKIGTLDSAYTNVAAAIAGEVTRATGVEADLLKAINDEVKRAGDAEKANADNLTAEINRATKAEEDLDKAVKAAQKDVDDLDALVGFVAGTGENDPKTVKAYIDAKVSEINGDADDLEARVKANEDAIELLNDGEDVTGSVANTAKLAAQKATTALVNGAPEALDTLKEIADWISEQQATGEDGATQLVSKIEKNASAIVAEKTRAEKAESDLDKRLQALEGDGEGSVADQIKDAVEALDAELDQKWAEAQGLQLHIKEVDGKITEFSGDINTVAKTDIDALFPTTSTPEVTE